MPTIQVEENTEAKCVSRTIFTVHKQIDTSVPHPEFLDGVQH